MLTCPICKSELTEGDLFGGEPVFACKRSKEAKSCDPLSKNYSSHYIRFGVHSDFTKVGHITLNRRFSDNTTKIKYDGLVIMKTGQTQFEDILYAINRCKKLLVML